MRSGIAIPGINNTKFLLISSSPCPLKHQNPSSRPTPTRMSTISTVRTSLLSSHKTPNQRTYRRPLPILIRNRNDRASTHCHPLRLHPSSPDKHSRRCAANIHARHRGSTRSHNRARRGLALFRVREGVVDGHGEPHAGDRCRGEGEEG